MCDQSFFMGLELQITSISYAYAYAYQHICVPWHNNQHRVMCFSQCAQRLTGVIERH